MRTAGTTSDSALRSPLTPDVSLLLFRSLWTNGLDLRAAVADCRGWGFDGVEGPAPADPGLRRLFASSLKEAGLPYIAEIVTGGGYVPTDFSAGRHLEDFRRQAQAAAECSPLFLTVLGGCDGWSLPQSVDFLGTILGAAAELGLVASIETHRSRPTYSPWATRDLLRQLPELRLTCDFSHWCCVCERLVLDDEPGILELCAARAHHVHARVGYEQGPQVPDPSAPQYRGALEAHERWWAAIWAVRSGRAPVTMTPEFGPDGYLHTEPFTGAPVANLDAVNRWMGSRLRERYERLEAQPALGASFT
jgi:sugar phosphate isomerase/epimerase